MTSYNRCIRQLTRSAEPDTRLQRTDRAGIDPTSFVSARSHWPPKMCGNSRAVEVDGSIVRISTRGHFDANPPLLLINGIGARLEMWRPFTAALQDRPLVMFDLPGIAGRPAPGLPLSMPGLAKWLTRLMDTINVEHADIFGYSWGGLLAQQVAKDAAQRVRGLVLAATNYGAGATPIPPLSILQLLNPLLNTRGDDPWKLLTAGLGGAPNDRNILEAMLNTLNPQTTPLAGQLRQLWAHVGWTSLPWLHTLDAPTLIIAGDDDPFIPTSTARTLVETIPDARLELIRGGGHLLPTNQPAQIAHVVGQFLNALDKRSAPFFIGAETMRPDARG